jgi:VanZ family protein
MSRNILLKRWAALLFLLFIGLVIVAADTDSIPPFIRDIYRFPGGDLVGHFVLYGILAFLSIRAFPRRLHLGRVSVPLVMLLVVALAVLEEVSQFWFPLRTPDLRDLGCGLIGILAGTWLAGLMEAANRTLQV